MNTKLIESVKSIFDDIDTSNFNINTRFKENDEWDSLTALTLITVIDNDFGVNLSGEEINNCQTIEELLNILNEKK